MKISASVSLVSKNLYKWTIWILRRIILLKLHEICTAYISSYRNMDLTLWKSVFILVVTLNTFTTGKFCFMYLQKFIKTIRQNFTTYQKEMEIYMQLSKPWTIVWSLAMSKLHTVKEAIQVKVVIWQNVKK